jgi:hypothetical protein
MNDKFVRVSAIFVGDDGFTDGETARQGDDRPVHVLFRRGGREARGGEYQGWLMNRRTYHAIPFGVDATPDDYRKHGELIPAPSDYLWRAA